MKKNLFVIASALVCSLMLAPSNPKFAIAHFEEEIDKVNPADIKGHNELKGKFTIIK